MPQKNAQGIDVSAEEERFLRRAFRRFALPYLLLFAALAWGASLLGGSDAGGASTDSVLVLTQQVEQLSSNVAELEGRLATLGADLARADARVAALEQESGKAVAADPALERKLREATRRMSELEKKLADQAVGERFDALAARMTKLERQARPAAPSPLTPPAAPSREAPPLSPPAATPPQL